MFVFARKPLRHRISNIEQSIENTGILHVFPNKGGLLCALTVDGTKLAFVSCHLTAHEGVKHCEDRNASIVEILGGVRAGDKRIDITEQFHHVIWMGDMNYRTTFDSATPANTKKNIAHLHAMLGKGQLVETDGDAKIANELVQFGEDDGEESEEEGEELSKKAERTANLRRVLDMVAKRQYEEILKYDELNREIAANRVLNDFTALVPTFPPTFKRARHLIMDPADTQTQATASTADSPYGPPPSPSKNKIEHPLLQYYNHKRLPSYTDRILYKSTPTFKHAVHPTFFESCEAATSSDHKPIRAGFEVDLHKGVEEILVDKNLPLKKRHPDTQTLKLTLSNLKGHDLEEMDSQLFGGGSDPYIVITTDPSHLLLAKGKLHCDDNVETHGTKTSVIKHDLNPVWKDVIELELASVDIASLTQNASLIFAVWDEDMMNAHDLIGVLTIPLKAVFESFQKYSNRFTFDDVLRCNSEVMGRISGTISYTGNFHQVLQFSQQSIDTDREKMTNFIPLAEAVAEAKNHQVGCSCTVN